MKVFPLTDRHRRQQSSRLIGRRGTLPLRLWLVLAVVAIIPSLISSAVEVNYTVASFYGGTGLLIVISVALDLVQKINSHLVMRNYPGLTED